MKVTELNDEFSGIGGSYKIVDGVRVRDEEPTAPPAPIQQPADGEPVAGE